MKHHRSRFYPVVSSLFIALLFVVSTPATLAQEGDAQYINFRVQTVKQESLAQWASLRKEISDAAKEAGAAFYHVYQRERGPLGVFLIVSPATPIGEPAMGLGEQPQLDVSPHWLNAVRSTLQSQTLVTLQAYPDLSTDDEASHPGENYAHVRIRTPRPGMGAEFEAWLRDDLVPGLREAGAGDVRNARVVLGGSPRTWVTWSFVPGWPEGGVELDPAVIEKVGGLIATQTDYFYRFREDLSFTAE